jgi:hypothetical protein
MMNTLSFVFCPSSFGFPNSFKEQNLLFRPARTGQWVRAVQADPNVTAVIRPKNNERNQL